MTKKNKKKKKNLEQNDGSHSFWRSKEFINLQAEWYEKLRHKNFSDIEHFNKKSGAGLDTPYLVDHSLKMLKNYDALVQNHYRLARNFLHHYKFSKRIYKILWELYCDGKSYRQMIPIIKKRAKKERSVFWISTHINRLKAEMAAFNVNHPDGLRDYEDLKDLEAFEAYYDANAAEDSEDSEGSDV